MRVVSLLALLPALALSQNPEALYKERKYDEAAAAAKVAVAANKNDHQAMWVLGKIAENNGKHDDAIDLFEKCVKLDEKNALYHYWLGAAVGSVAQNASTLRQPFLAKRVKNEFEKASQLDPTLVEARQGLMDFYQMAPGIMGGSNAKAREQLGEIRKLNAYRGHFSAARYAQRDKDLPGAQKEWEAAVREFPDSVVPWYNLGGSLRQQSKWDEAFAHYETMYKRFPNEVTTHLAWGVTAVQADRQLDKGEKEIKYFLANAVVEKVGIGNVSGAHFRLGQIYEKTNRKPEAKASYSEALKVNPNYTDAKKALAALK